MHGPNASERHQMEGAGGRQIWMGRWDHFTGTKQQKKKNNNSSDNAADDDSGA